MSGIRRMNLSKVERYDTRRIVLALLQLDESLTQDTSIALCGTASVLLQQVKFRETMGIDFCSRPPAEVLLSIESVFRGESLFDTNACGIIGLLVDYDDRLVEVKYGFKHLHVFCLSKRDWIVSKLASPKVDDVLNRTDITLEDLLWVKKHMLEYGGVSINRAHNDLEMLIEEVRKRG